MIDARLWTRPSPDEIRAMVESLCNDRSFTATVKEIGARLGVGRRRVFHWISPNQEPGREISYAEWYLLNEIVNGDGEMPKEFLQFVGENGGAAMVRVTEIAATWPARGLSDGKTCIRIGLQAEPENATILIVDHGPDHVARMIREATAPQ